MHELRVGIVGAGFIARQRHIPCFQNNERAALVAVADVSAKALEQVKSELGVATTYTDYGEMYEKERLDAVCICTPNKLHAPMTIEALRRGMHVLCEKPMALNADEGRAMVQAASQANKVLSIAFHYRHKGASQAARRVVEAGELGDIYMVRVLALRRRGIPTWGVFTNKDLQGGGALIDYGVHLLDLALWLMGNPKAVEVTGVTSKRLGTRPNVNPGGDWGYDRFQVEDHAAAFIRLEGGKALQLEASWALNIAESVENVSLSGTDGGLDVFPFRVNKAAHGMLVRWTPDWMPGTQDDGGIGQTADFVDAVLEGRQPVAKAEEALQVSEIIDAIYKSSAIGSAIKLGG
jgi:predicted dehydrogenase